MRLGLELLCAYLYGPTHVDFKSSISRDDISVCQSKRLLEVDA